MHLAVDDTRQDMQSGRFDHRRGRCAIQFAKRGDPALPHTDIDTPLTIRRDERAASNNQIKLFGQWSVLLFARLHRGVRANTSVPHAIPSP